MNKETLLCTQISLLIFKKTTGMIKPMHAVNNGPLRNIGGEPSRQGNFQKYKEAAIPYARVHDASFEAEYGGEHSVDIQAIFPDFTKNPYDEDSYDFTLTDVYLTTIHDAGTETFYRFGSKIEHWCKKYGTKVPADFHKFAIICEHIIRHYNYGWANGFHYNIRYWEIWNEPDGVKDNGDQPNWSGTPEEFFELYAETATHLKQRFPELKIGGPALSWIYQPWFDNFLAYLTKDGRRVPLDFFSWHVYLNDPYGIAKHSEYARQKLDDYGYTETESICNEYNYLIDFTTHFTDSVLGIIGIRGAALVAAAMSVGQSVDTDMLMYYDAQPCQFNGLFDYYTYAPLKGYYSILYFSKLYALGQAVAVSSDDREVFITAATGESGKAMLVTYYPMPEENATTRTVQITAAPGTWLCHLVDADHTDVESTITTDNGTITLDLAPNSIVLLEQK